MKEKTTTEAIVPSILIQPKVEDDGSSLSIIKRLQQTIDAEKEKLRFERTNLLAKVAEIDLILGLPTESAPKERKQRTTTEGKLTAADAILKVLSDGQERGVTQIIGGVQALGKSKFVQIPLMKLVEQKKVLNVSRGRYKIA